MYRLTRWSLGGLFIYAGAMKLLAPKSFAVLMDAFGLLPDFLLLPAAVTLPLLEIAAGAGLVFDIRGGLGAVAGLLLLFVAVLGYGVWLGLDIDCGCFGPGDPEGEAFHGLKPALFRDLAMLAPVASLYWWRRLRSIRPVNAASIVKRFRDESRKGNVYA